MSGDYQISVDLTLARGLFCAEGPVGDSESDQNDGRWSAGKTSVRRIVQSWTPGWRRLPPARSVTPPGAFWITCADTPWTYSALMKWVADDWSQGSVAVPPRCGGFRDGKRTPSRAVRDKSRRAGR